MTLNLDPAAALGFLIASPPLIGASLAVIAMLALWLASKVLKFAQMGLAAVAIVFLVRFVMSGSVDDVPPQVAPEAPQAAAPSWALGMTSHIGGGEVRIDSSGFTFHVPFGANQPVDALLQGNQAQVQRALAQATPTVVPARN
jgi:hypothetical protein